MKASAASSQTPSNSIRGAWSNQDPDKLLEEARNGNAQAREELFTHLSRSLRNIAAARLRGGLARYIDDSVQDALVTVFRRLDDVETNIGGYAYRCLLHTISHIYRDPRTFVPEPPPMTALTRA